MSKSLGNFRLAADVLAVRDPLVVRYALGAAHYRSSLDISDQAFDEAESALERIRTFQERAVRLLAPEEGEWSTDAGVPERFAAAMDDDLGVPQALAVIHETVREGNLALDAGNQDAVAATFAAVAVMTGILGIDPLDPQWSAENGGAEASALGALVRTMIDQRAAARASKDWATADRIRDAIAAAGIVLEDGPDGTHWSVYRG
jgi:cysteinyl-tRNA synthetase